MPDLTAINVKRLSDLAQTARELTMHGRGGGSDLFYEAYYAWQVSAASAIHDLTGDQSTYSQAFDMQTQMAGPTAAAVGHGLLQQVRKDLEAGYLRRTEDLVAAEVFADFLEMAEHLGNQGYFHAAASLAGAVLEDGLRRLSVHNNIETNPRDDVSSMNGRLAAKKVYSRLDQKRVEVMSHVRNLADHGKFDEVTPEDVRPMLTEVRSFLAQHLA